MRLKLFLSVLFFCSITKAQTNTELKDFINKNNVAIRSVQKNMISKEITSFTISFKELLKKQQASVKEYSSDKKNCVSLAFDVRKECLDFLKTNTKSNMDYFEITADENKMISFAKVGDLKTLTVMEMKMIDEMDVFNFQSLNTFILIIK